ncbi:MAG: hypothetical protein A3J35_04335 [Gammaproteobacteria bacterium RIFCSPLOWO2_02_FULL_52_10]|nr:MAG: hypothetical protein A3J35_04335 [Gammaproteobacteria bacterium RIFCSPLOWO2_02_FULL_52_10]
MSSETEICNRALQKLGAGRITSLTQDSANARSCNVAYEPIRDAELRAHPWSFSVKRVQLAALATAPTFYFDNQFQLPSDFLRLLPRDRFDNLADLDWTIEGRNLLTDDAAPLDVRYVAKITDPNTMDALFREALSSKIAYELCEEITQSNTKKEAARTDYIMVIREARRINAIEKTAEYLPEDEWLTARA